MSISQTNQYLDSLLNYELTPPVSFQKAFTLDRIRCLLEILGNPQDKLKIIHVAGSKGKGSTCAMTAEILKAGGYRVGLYTSPHFDNYRERIRILDKDFPRRISQDIFSDCISARDLERSIAAIKPAVDKIHEKKSLGALTFFEVMTALAFCYFLEQKVHFVVLETGLGGRLDATNVASSLVCVITPISLEHTQWLGETIPEITREKAGIIKNANQRVVLAPQPNDAQKVLIQQCRKYSIVPVVVGRDIKPDHRISNLGLLGAHQRVNAMTAIGICECLQKLGFKIDESAVSLGLKRVYWPGRFEVISKDPTIILDGAHNEDSARRLASTVKEIYPKKKVILVWGVSEDKAWRSIARELRSVVKSVVFTKAEHPRALEVAMKDLKAQFPGQDVSIVKNVALAFKKVSTELRKDDIILVTGSIFLVAEARRLFVKRSQNTRISDGEFR